MPNRLTGKTLNYDNKKSLSQRYDAATDYVQSVCRKKIKILIGKERGEGCFLDFSLTNDERYQRNRVSYCIMLLIIKKGWMVICSIFVRV